MMEDLISNRVLIAGDRTRAKRLNSLASEFIEEGAEPLIVPLSISEKEALKPSMNALLYGEIDNLCLAAGWSQSRVAVILRLSADLLGITTIYVDDSESEEAPETAIAEMKGFSLGMIEANKFLEEVTDGDSEL